MFSTMTAADDEDDDFDLDDGVINENEFTPCTLRPPPQSMMVEMTNKIADVKVNDFMVEIGGKADIGGIWS
jgi:hypothetical protein